MIVLYGGDGFLGRHIGVLAHQRGLPFTVVSRTGDRGFVDRHAPSGSVLSVEAFHGEAGGRLLARAQALVHLAWRTVPGSRLSDPSEVLELDVGPAWKAFERALATAAPGLRVVFLSTGGAMYGHGGEAPITEAQAPAPLCAYGAGKLMAEAALKLSCARHGGVARILRPSNPIGRWHRRADQGIVGVATRRLLRGDPVELFGDGRAVRDYLDADDLAAAVLAAAGAQGGDGLWNVGSGDGRTVLEVVDMVGAALGVAPAIRFIGERACDPGRVVLDASAFRERFDWRPERPFEAAVGATVAAIRESGS